MNLIIVLLPLLIIFFKLKNKKGGVFHPSVILVLIYLVSVVSSIPYLFFENFTSAFNRSNFLPPSIYFISVLFLFLYPIISLREDKLVYTIVYPKLSLLIIFSYAMLALSLFSVFYFIGSIKNLFMADIGDLRIQMASGELQVVENSIFNTIAGSAASLYQIPMLLFFVFRSKQIKKTLSTLLLISSTSYIFFVFAYFGRDGVVFWSFSFLGFWALFSRCLPIKMNKTLKKVFSVLMILFSISFLIITFARFQGEALEAIISYLGQSYPNFCLAYNADPPLDYGEATIPLFRSWLGLEDVDRYFQNVALENGGTVSWVFGTFINSFMLSFGKWATFIIALVYVLITKLHFRKKYLTFSNLLIYSLLFQILSQGVFYFRQYNRVGNLTIIVYIAFAIIFSLVKKTNARY